MAQTDEYRRLQGGKKQNKKMKNKKWMDSSASYIVACFSRI